MRSSPMRESALCEMRLLAMVLGPHDGDPVIKLCAGPRHGNASDLRKVLTSSSSPSNSPSDST